MINFINIIIVYQSQQKNIGKGLFKESNANIQKISKNKKTENVILLKKLFINIDVLVDGPFILELKSYNVPFRGSSNQRIIDSKKSIIENMVCEIQK